MSDELASPAPLHPEEPVLDAAHVRDLLADQPYDEAEHPRGVALAWRTLERTAAATG